MVSTPASVPETSTYQVDTDTSTSVSDFANYTTHAAADYGNSTLIDYDNSTQVDGNVTLADFTGWQMALGGTSALICILGVVSNLWLFAMTMSRELRNTSYGIILAVISLLNVSYLGFRAVHTWHLFVQTSSLILTRSLHLRKGDLFGLCLLEGIERCIAAMSSWLMVLLAAERTLHLMLPLQRLRVTTPCKVIIACLLSILICLAIYIPPMSIMLTGYRHGDFIPDTPSPLWARPLLSELCTAMSHWVHHVYNVYASLVYILPTCLILVCSAIMTVELRSRIKKLKLLIVTDDIKEALIRISLQNKVTFSMLILLLQFCIFQLPVSIYLMSVRGIHTYVPIHIVSAVGDINDSFVYIIIREVLELLTLIPYSSPLWVLLLTASYFRRLFYQVTCRRRVLLEADLSRTNTQQRQAIRKRLNDFNKTHTEGVIGKKLGWTSKRQEPMVFASAYTLPVGIGGPVADVIRYESTHGDVSRTSSTETILKETAIRLDSLSDDYKL